MRKSIYLCLIGLLMSATAIAQPSYFKVSASNNTVVYEENGNLGTVFVLFQWSKQWIPMDSNATQKFTDTTAANTQLSFLLNGADSGTVYYFKATIMDSATGMVLVTLPPTGRDSMITVCGTISVAASAAPATICNGSSTTLTGSGASTYVWSTGASTSSIVVSPISNQSYSVTGTDANGCTGVDSVSITVNSIPTLTVSATPSTICIGASSSLTAAGATSYLWNPGAQTGSSIVVSPTASTTYTVDGTDANGCMATLMTTVIANPVPVVSASGAATLCIGSSTNLSASGASTYTWAPVTGLSNPNISNPVATPSVTTSYTVTGTSLNCSDTSVVTVVVNNLPVISLSGITTICNGDSTVLTAVGATSYLWNPGAQTGSVVTVSPITNTIYTVVGIDPNGCMGINTISVTVNAVPTMTVSASFSAICVGASSTLSAGGAVTYLWNPGAMFGSSVLVSPTASTTYTVDGTNANGCTSSQIIAVTVNNLPIISIASSTTICNGSSTTLTASGGASYLWSSGPTTVSIVVSPTSTQSYSVTGTDANGCVNVDSANVTVNAMPIVTVSTPAAICNGNSATLTAAGATTYLWNPGAQTGSSVTVSPTSNTTYTVVGTDPIGCAGTATVLVAVDGPLVLSGNLPIAYAGQPNYSGSFSVTGSSTPCTYALTAPALPYGLSLLPLVGTFDPITYPTASGFSTFQITATNTSGCSVAQWFSMQVDDPNPGTLQSLSSYSITALSPAPTLTLTVSGGVDSATVALKNGSQRVTNYLSPTQVEMVLLAADVASPTQFPIKVVNPTYPNGTNSILFSVIAGPPSTVASVTVTGVYCSPDGANYPNSKALVTFTYSSLAEPLVVTEVHDSMQISLVTPAPASPINLGQGSGQYSWTIYDINPNTTLHAGVKFKTPSMATAAISNEDTCITFVGVDEIEQGNSQVNIFPNPLTSGVSQINCGLKEGTLVIDDALGREVMKAQVKDGKCEIGERPASGVYVIRLFDADRQPAGWSKLLIE